MKCSSEESTPGSIVNKKQGGVSRRGAAELGPAFWNGAATAAMPSGVLIFLFTFFIKEKSKKEILSASRQKRKY
ncbi:MAG: hypothetical protein J0L69_01115 [Bacteroidetes bacterium]|nr:hypothetical protein [Bacteroidota bacterium]